MKSTSYIGAFVFALPIFVALTAHGISPENEKPEGLLYSSYKTHVLVQDQGIAIMKKAGLLELQSIKEIGSGPDIQLVFANEEQGICSSITIYKAPDGTVGPKLVLDEKGNPIVATNSDNPYAVFELTEPSESYTGEFWRVVKGIEKEFSLEFKNKDRKPARHLAIPENQKHSPIAYVAFFSGAGKFKSPDLAGIPWDWEFDLFVVGNDFIKIHTEGPRGSIIGASVDVISAINWRKISGLSAGDDTDGKPNATDSDGIEDPRREAELGNADAQFNLGLVYAHGEGVPLDYAEAAKWLTKAAEQGDPRAQYNLGILYLGCDGVPKDDSSAVKWFEKAANQGNADAQVYLGSMYYEGRGVRKDAAKAVGWYRKSAEQGNAEGQGQLGIAYANGEGVDQDITEAEKWFRKAAEQGNAQAQCNLGRMFRGGDGVAQDDVEAVKWFRLAAEQGHAAAQFYLGDAFISGRGVSQDYVEAASWLRKAAEQGEVEAMFDLGLAYAYGKGVDQNFEAAVNWLGKAARCGDAPAQFHLGMLYFNGDGVKQDKTEAMQLIRKAAELEYADAQYTLGTMYAHGDGVEEDQEKSVMWLKKAAGLGHEEAQEALRALGLELEGGKSSEPHK